jgi:hypothetical protein
LPEFNRDELREIKSFPQLIKYLRDELDWPIEADDFEDSTFDYDPEELGLEPKTAICPLDYTYEDSLANIMEAKARGAYVIGVSNSQTKMFDESIKISSCEEILYPLVTTIPLQLFAYYSAIARGLDPDKPRNLAKSVTVK